MYLLVWFFEAAVSSTTEVKSGCSGEFSLVSIDSAIDYQSALYSLLYMGGDAITFLSVWNTFESLLTNVDPIICLRSASTEDPTEPQLRSKPRVLLRRGDPCWSLFS